MAQMLRAVTAFSAGLDEWMTQLDELARLGAQLRQAGERLSQAVDSPALTAQTVSALDQDDPRVAQLSQLLNLWLEMQETKEVSPSSMTRTRLRGATLRRMTSICLLLMETP